MARGGKGRSGRRYVRDAKGRFASKGYTGQTGGRGARLKSGKGNIRQVGGQKRGERHILRSPESKAAGKAATAAAVRAGGIIVSRKYGGKGKSINSAEYKAASRVKETARARRDAAELRSGLPKSGGAMRVRGGIKRDPKVGEKLAAAKTSKRQAAKSKPASQPKVTRSGSRIDPARQADRASTAKVNKALSAEKAARAAAFSSKESFSSPKRQELTRKLNEATQNTAAQIQTRRNVRASFPVMRKTPTTKASRLSGTIKAPTSTKAQRSRASQNLTRSLDSRGRAVGKKNRRTKKAAERAAQFYSNPLKALKSVNNKGTGFKLPRSMRRKRK